MKFPKPKCLFIALGLALVPLADAQEKAAPIAQKDHPVYALTFKAQATVAVSKAPQLFSPPILCSPDGTAYFGVPEPPLYREQTIYSLDTRELRSYSYRDVQGLNDAHFLGFFPGERGVFLMVNATQNPEESQAVAVSQQGNVLWSGTGFRGEHREFLVKFDKAGGHEDPIALPADLSFHRFAELEDGSFVALAIDRANAAVRLPLLTLDGKIMRYLPVPPALSFQSNSRKGSRDNAVGLAMAETIVTRWYFAPARHKVLLYATNIDAPVLEIGPDGVTREVSIAVPKGFFLDGIIPSDDRWIVRFARRKSPKPGEFSIKWSSAAGDYALYEVDFNDGSLRRELSMASIPGFGVACEEHGALTGFSFMRDSKFILFTADLPR